MLMYIRSTWYARPLAALMFLSVAASAQAATIYDFTFTDNFDPTSIVGAGSFETGDASSADPGYFLVTDLTFHFVTGGSGTVYSGPFVRITSEPSAAYNPVTGAFINHFAGNTYNNIGLATFSDGASSLVVFGSSFGTMDQLDGVMNPGANSDTLRHGYLTVTPAVTAVPEPTSVLLLGSGLLGAALARRRRR